MVHSAETSGNINATTSEGLRVGGTCRRGCLSCCGHLEEEEEDPDETFSGPDEAAAAARSSRSHEIVMARRDGGLTEPGPFPVFSKRDDLLTLEKVTS